MLFPVDSLRQSHLIQVTISNTAVSGVYFLTYDASATLRFRRTVGLYHCTKFVTFCAEINSKFGEYFEEMYLITYNGRLRVSVNGIYSRPSDGTDMTWNSMALMTSYAWSRYAGRNDAEFYNRLEDSHIFTNGNFVNICQPKFSCFPAYSAYSRSWSKVRSIHTDFSIGIVAILVIWAEPIT